MVQIKQCHSKFRMVSSQSLPLEIIIYILKFASFSDRKQARLVCHQWYYACQDPYFLQQEVLEVKHNKQISALLNSNRVFHHVVFKGTDLNWRIKQFWDQFGPFFRSVTLLHCDIHERDFIDMLRCCPKLESLRTTGCRELLMSGCILSDNEDIHYLSTTLGNLKELSIEDNSYLCDAIFNRFVAICPHLESLSFNSCQISFHQGLCKKFYPNLENGDCMLASSSILTFQNIYKYVCKNAQRVRRLSFSRTILDSQALTQLAQVVNLCVDSIHLSRCEQLTNAGIIALAQNQYFVQHLDLSHCSRVTDAAVISICQNLKLLKHLDLRDCGALTNESISELHNLQSLIYLDLSNCRQIANEGILNGVCASSHTANLRKLSLSGISNVTPDVIVRLAHDLPNVTHLDLSYCHTAVTDASIQAVFQHQISLRCLNVSGCSNITDAGLTGMGMGIDTRPLPSSTTSNGSPQCWNQPLPSINPPLKSFPAKISLRSRAEKEIVEDAIRKKAVLQLCEHNLLSGKSTGYSLARLTGLRTLHLRGCSRISDVSFYYAFKFLQLELLDITQCHQVTHEGLKSLSEKNPSIESLVLDQCLSVTDDAVLTLANNLRRLTILSLQGCQKLTLQSLHHISRHCNSLRKLDMRNCLGLDRNSVIPRLDNVSDLLVSVAFSDHQYPPPMPPPMPI